MYKGICPKKIQYNKKDGRKTFWLHPLYLFQTGGSIPIVETIVSEKGEGRQLEDTNIILFSMLFGCETSG
jgi:hypothetical protein